MANSTMTIRDSDQGESMKFLLLNIILMTSFNLMACRVRVTNGVTNESKTFQATKFPFKLSLGNSNWVCFLDKGTYSKESYYGFKCSIGSNASFLSSTIDKHSSDYISSILVEKNPKTQFVIEADRCDLKKSKTKKSPAS